MPAPSESVPPRPQKTLYGRRKGAKLSAHQTRVVETLLPQLRLDLRENADPREYFAADVEEVWFEIGFGAGEHLLWQAEHSPNVGIVGAEPYESGVAKLLSKLYAISAPLFPSPAEQSGAGEVPNAQFAREAEGAGARGDTPPPPSRPSGSTPPPLAARSREREQESLSPDSGALRGKGNLLGRIRLYTGDARDIIGALPDASLGRIFLLFPDPWPKKRHHKRRFIQMETLDALARVMKPGAQLRFASDDPGYISWTLERVMAHDEFVWSAQRSNDWLLRPADWPVTRYEQKALHGLPVFFRFQRCGKGRHCALANRPSAA